MLNSLTLPCFLLPCRSKQTVHACTIPMTCLCHSYPCSSLEVALVKKSCIGTGVPGTAGHGLTSVLVVRPLLGLSTGYWGVRLNDTIFGRYPVSREINAVRMSWSTFIASQTDQVGNCNSFKGPYVHLAPGPFAQPCVRL